MPRAAASVANPLRPCLDLRLPHTVEERRRAASALQACRTMAAVLQQAAEIPRRSGQRPWVRTFASARRSRHMRSVNGSLALLRVLGSIWAPVDPLSKPPPLATLGEQDRTACMTRIYLPTTGSHDWQWLLAKPGALEARRVGDGARRRLGARGRWPEPVAAALAGDAQLTDLELLLAFPEHQVPSQADRRLADRPLRPRPADQRRSGGDRGRGQGRGTVRRQHRRRVARQRETAGRPERLPYLLDVLGLTTTTALAAIRYQLLHRTASAIIEARRFGAAPCRDARALVQPHGRVVRGLRRLRGAVRRRATRQGTSRPESREIGDESRCTSAGSAIRRSPSMPRTPRPAL